MAAQTRGSSSLFGLIVFVILFVFALGFAIFGWMRASSEENRANTATKSLDAVIAQRDRNDPKFEALPKAGPGETTVGVLLKEYKKRDAEATVAQKGLDEANAELKRQQDANAKLTADLKNAVTTIAQMSDARAKEVAALAGERDTAVKNYKAKETELASFTQQVKDQYAAHQAQVDKLTTDCNKQTADLQAQVKEKVDRIAVLDEEIARMKRPLIKGQENEKLKFTPDGKITIAPGIDGMAYINLGLSKHVTLGMTFEVYDPTDLIEPDQYGDLHGKATVEIVRVLDNRAMVRVVRLNRGQRVMEDDVIANVAYDPNITFKFFVFGDFDIDRTGTPSPADAKRIEGLISQFGGVVVDKLSYETDYVVLGTMPRRPDPLATDETDTRRLAEFKAAEQKYNDYQMLIGEATSRHLPVLNQNQFIQLVGYYQRLAVLRPTAVTH